VSMESPAGAFSPGSVVAGKYRVDRVLGSGGMALVLAATHLQLRQPVAIKVLHRQTLARPGAFDRFVREARVAMRLKSEHVARVLDIATDDHGTPFIVMELLEGADFAVRLKEGGPFAAEDAVRPGDAGLRGAGRGPRRRRRAPRPEAGEPVFMRGGRRPAAGQGARLRRVEAARSVAGRRARGDGRGDGADEDGGARSDAARAGMESAPATVTVTRAFLGSPHYMAPEQMKSARDVDARADVWALGVILYELVSGARAVRRRHARRAGEGDPGARAAAAGGRAARARHRAPWRAGQGPGAAVAPACGRSPSRSSRSRSPRGAPRTSASFAWPSRGSRGSSAPRGMRSASSSSGSRDRPVTTGGVGGRLGAPILALAAALAIGAGRHGVVAPARAGGRGARRGGGPTRAHPAGARRTAPAPRPTAARRRCAARPMEPACRSRRRTARRCSSRAISTPTTRSGSARCSPRRAPSPPPSGR